MHAWEVCKRLYCTYLGILLGSEVNVMTLDMSTRGCVSVQFFVFSRSIMHSPGVK